MPFMVENNNPTTSMSPPLSRYNWHELKSVDQLRPIHEAQLLTYLKLAGLKQGYLINFNVTRLEEGLQSLVL
ncbi:MAG: GxxExxY protein [Phycisphaerae bacterium]|nr:GxxExxY protein [Phycisphaerae bacterium]